MTGFVSKNNFALTEDLVELFLCSSNSFLADLFGDVTIPKDSDEVLQRTDVKQRGGGGGGSSTKKRVGTVSLSAQFRKQVDELMLQLKGTESHYVKVYN